MKSNPSIVRKLCFAIAMLAFSSRAWRPISVNIAALLVNESAFKFSLGHSICCGMREQLWRFSVVERLLI
jgi:hypothetical protein